MFRRIVLSSVTVATLTLTSAAQSAERPGYRAFGALTPFDTQLSMQSDAAQMSKARATALADCNRRVAGMSQSAWGVQQTSVYRACMAERSQFE